MTASATLDTIRSTVRKITGRPSVAQITDDTVDFYINTYYLYDMPEELRLMSLTDNYTFFTEPNIDTYAFPKDRYSAISKPIYVGGYDQELFQDQQTFYAVWPKVQFRQTVAIGDGVTSNLPLANLTNTPVLRGCVSLCANLGPETLCYLDNNDGRFVNEPFDITGITNDAQAIVTVPGHNFLPGEEIYIENVFGMTQINGGPYTIIAVVGDDIRIDVDATLYNQYVSGGGASVVRGTIDYITGAISLDWVTPPIAGTEIVASYVPYAAARPRNVLFFNNELILRPVPDQAYKVTVQVERFPTELLNDPQTPELRQWWQLLALGASLKIFRDSGDFEEAQKYYPYYDDQLRLVLRRTLNQLKNQKVLTPYSDNQYLNQTPFNNYYGAF